MQASGAMVGCEPVIVKCDFIVFVDSVICVMFCSLCAMYHFHITELSSCTTGDVRLVDGDSEMEERVEVCGNGVWGAVYDSGVQAEWIWRKR